jgi:hypothetical protein
MAAEPSRTTPPRDEATAPKTVEHAAPGEALRRPPPQDSDDGLSTDPTWRSRLVTSTLIVMGVALAGLFVATDPAHTVATDALLLAGTGIVTASLAALACVALIAVLAEHGEPRP